MLDCDQHLYEYRGMWRDHIDPDARDLALELVDDDLGHTWLTWCGRRLGPADVQLPGETDAVGERRRRERAGEPPIARYDDALPRAYWEPSARLAVLDAMGVDGAMLFPNHGLLWEREVGEASRPALRANLTAWNRWCATVRADGRGLLHPVGHLALDDLGWLRRELAALERADVRTAMIAPALVDGKRLSHPDLDGVWRAFVDHGISPVFHVADQPRIFAEGWYATDTGDSRGAADAGRDFGPPVLESVFLHTAAAVACTDLIIHGVLDRHPDLRLGVVELSAVWVPMYLMMLDGGAAFVRRLNGRAPYDLPLPPSEYFIRQVRVSSFAYELPANLARQLRGADLLMACSDYPHSEGTATPLADYARGATFGTTPADAPGLFGGNAEFLLRAG